LSICIASHLDDSGSVSSEWEYIEVPLSYIPSFLCTLRTLHPTTITQHHTSNYNNSAMPYTLGDQCQPTLRLRHILNVTKDTDPAAPYLERLIVKVEEAAASSVATMPGPVFQRMVHAYGDRTGPAYDKILEALNIYANRALGQLLKDVDEEFTKMSASNTQFESRKCYAKIVVLVLKARGIIEDFREIRLAWMLEEDLVALEPDQKEVLMGLRKHTKSMETCVHGLRAWADLIEPPSLRRVEII
jgi:hypothetical protein